MDLVGSRQSLDLTYSVDYDENADEVNIVTIKKRKIVELFELL